MSSTIENMFLNWKTIKEYPQYEVSPLGEVRRLGETRPLTPIKDKDGYHQVHLCIHNVSDTRKIHRLVAIAFIPNPKDKPFVNHINGKPWDNRVENLEWVTGQENTAHAFATGLAPRGESRSYSKLTEVDVRDIKEMLRDGVSMGSIGRDFNVSVGCIRNIKSERTWKHVK